MPQPVASNTEGQGGGKRLRRVGAKRPDPAFSPTLLFAFIAAVVLVIGVIAGAMALHKPPPDAGAKPASTPAKEAPPPAPKDASPQ
jgi:hypothetical protein